MQEGGATSREMPRRTVQSWDKVHRPCKPHGWGEVAANAQHLQGKSRLDYLHFRCWIFFVHDTRSVYHMRLFSLITWCFARTRQWPPSHRHPSSLMARVTSLVDWPQSSRSRFSPVRKLWLFVVRRSTFLAVSSGTRSSLVIGMTAHTLTLWSQ